MPPPTEPQHPEAVFPDTHAAVVRSEGTGCVASSFERLDDAELMSEACSVDAKLVPWEQSASGGRGRVYFHPGKLRLSS